MELSEFLGGEPVPESPASTVETAAPVEEAAPATTAEQPVEAPRDERGRFVRQEAVEPPVVPEEKPVHTVPVAALLEERRKRQELEARLQQQTPQVKDEDFWNAPAKATQQVVAEQTQAIQQDLVNFKYQLAEDMTRTLHSDYDQVRDGFVSRVTANDPYAVAIAQQMGSHPNPAKFVYDQWKAEEARQKVGDLTGWEARIRAEERAKVLAEATRRPPAPDVPRSLNSEPSAPSSSTPEGYTPTPLENLVGYKF